MSCVASRTSCTPLLHQIFDISKVRRRIEITFLTLKNRNILTFNSVAATGDNSFHSHHDSIERGHDSPEEDDAEDGESGDGADGTAGCVQRATSHQDHGGRVGEGGEEANQARVVAELKVLTEKEKRCITHKEVFGCIRVRRMDPRITFSVLTS